MKVTPEARVVVSTFLTLTSVSTAVIGGLAWSYGHTVAGPAVTIISIAGVVLGVAELRSGLKAPTNPSQV